MDQLQHYETARRRIAGLHKTAIDIMQGINPLTPREVESLLLKRPAVYGSIAEYLRAHAKR